jgi:hypothetical protein
MFTKDMDRQEELIMAIGTYIDRHVESPKPFIWAARAGDILEKVKRAHPIPFLKLPIGLRFRKSQIIEWPDRVAVGGGVQ